VNSVDPSGCDPFDATGPHFYAPPPIGTVYGGLDITNLLQKGLSEVRTKFDALPDSQRWTICEQLVDIPDAAWAWDIPALLGNNPTTFGMSKGKWGTGDSQNTVTVNGRVYWAPAVNYALYGELMRLCYDFCMNNGHPLRAQAFTLQKTQQTAGIYRCVKTLLDGGGVSQAVAFATDGWNGAGWTGDWSAINSVGLPNAVPCSIVDNGVLGFRVGSKTPFDVVLWRGIMDRFGLGSDDPIEAIISVTAQ
jgi:hypothetical protein